MNLIEQMAIIAHEAHAEWTSAIMYGCLYFLGIIAVLALGRFVTRNLKRVNLPLWLIVAAIVYGGTKPVGHLWQFQYLNGLTDDGSTCEGDEIRAKWTATPILMDGNYIVKMTYRDAAITNSTGEVTDEWHEGEDSVVQDLQHTWIVPGATNMQVLVWAEYVSPVVVHTNGVYRLGGVMPTMDGATGRFVTASTTVKINMDSGEIEILTPTNRPPQSSNLLMQLNQEIEENE